MSNVRQNILAGTFQANALQYMDTMYKIEQAIAGVENMIALSIKVAIEDNQPAKQIVKMLKDLSEDNRPAIVYMLGEALTQKIEHHD